MYVLHYNGQRFEVKFPSGRSWDRRGIISQALPIPTSGDIYLASRTEPRIVGAVRHTISNIDEYDVIWMPSCWDQLLHACCGVNPYPSDHSGAKDKDGVEEDMPELLDSKTEYKEPTVYVSRQLRAYHNATRCEKGIHSAKIYLSEAKKRGLDRCLYCKWNT